MCSPLLFVACLLILLPTVRLSREILNCCVRNTEEAEKNSRILGSDEPSGRGIGKGVWSMIEGSELAKSIHTTEGSKVGDTFCLGGSPILIDVGRAS